MESLLVLCLIAIIVFVVLLLLKMKRVHDSKNNETVCLVCNEPLISSNYSICYKCRMKKHKVVNELESH